MLDSNGLAEPLMDPPDAKVDIVFVHGLTGDRVNTWTSEPTKRNPEPVFWPKDLLPAKCKNARILSFGYNATVVHFWPLSGSKPVVNTTVDNHSAALTDSLIGLRDRTKTNDRPVIFVAHSLGGLVCANAVSKSYGSDKAKENLAEKVRGMIFLGTPFAGSKKAKWAKIAADLLASLATTNADKVKDLEERSKLLMEINHNFARFIKERDRNRPWVEIACYFEEIPTRVMGKNIGFIVDKESATLEGIEPLSIQEEHADMCKFEDEYRNGFVSITDKLNTWIKGFEEKNQEDENEGGGIRMGNIHYHAPVSGNSGVVAGHVYSTATNGATLTGTQTNYYGANWADRR
ncbi:Alpha/Beta hydrolase protein [Diplogelasinospora grovesii]|uniref:Alpha/Beta hydrolase protein n=1 Tax=Diplogelasinospora grovesii TaxID=303347 RepID=A0AAN6S5K3_9PEZI|nr:Alpha/Beta hydrolase protein [Diplogelasinospora grovesii]